MLILRIVHIFVTWLLIASLVGIGVKKLRMPYTVGLVIAGLVIALVAPLIRNHPQGISPAEIKSLLIPNLILALLVPPLIFEAAFHLDLKELRPDLGKVVALAAPGVVVTTLLVGLVVAGAPELTMPVALVFGALISATDPVAVVALFRTVGAPERMVLLLEGESLFNDGTAIVLFHLMLCIVVAGGFNLLGSLVDFVRVAAGGLLVGLVIGTLISWLTQRIQDNYIEITLSIIAAYGAYLVAEGLHVSGALGVVAAGLVIGRSGFHALPDAVRERLDDFWEFSAFLANSFLFLLIGVTINLGAILTQPVVCILAILAVLIARAAVIYTFSRLAKNIPVAYQHVLSWGGLRGGVSLALAFSLTSKELGANLELVQAMAFSVVLFTIIVQGTTMAPLLKRLKLTEST